MFVAVALSGCVPTDFDGAMTDAIPSAVRLPLERYLEVSTHYTREIRIHLRDYENSTSRLDALISRLEAVADSAIEMTDGVDRSIGAEDTLGQNIVPTPDTLAALRVSKEEVLRRLDETQLASVPRNLYRLRTWLQREVMEIAAGFPSFTYAWDKLVDLSRLALVPDSRFLRVRDNLIMATIEFERFVSELAELSPPTEAHPGSTSVAMAPQEAFRSLCTPQVATLDASFPTRAARVASALEWRNGSLDQPTILRESARNADALALVGLEIGFTCWVGRAVASKEHRKAIIMSLLVCSKLLLVEASWQSARDFTTFAIALVIRMNTDLGVTTDDGTAMLRFNQLWARHKLGDNITDDLAQWDVSALHNRYAFLKSVLLRRFDDAVRILDTLLPPPGSNEPGNFSIVEADEWPILEDFRSSVQYQELRRRHVETTQA